MRQKQLTKKVLEILCYTLAYDFGESYVSTKDEKQNACFKVMFI